LRLIPRILVGIVLALVYFMLSKLSEPLGLAVSLVSLLILNSSLNYLSFLEYVFLWSLESFLMKSGVSSRIFFLLSLGLVGLGLMIGWF